MLIDGTDPFATAKPDARLVKLLIRARRFNATLVGGDGVPFAALAKREGVSPSYFTRLVRLSYLAPDITEAILDGCQPRDLTASQAAGAFASATWLARAAHRAWVCLSRSELSAGHIAEYPGDPTAFGTPVQAGCGTGIGPDRDITGSWCDVNAPRASLRGSAAWPRPRTPRQLPVFRHKKEKSSERRTVCWREPDSNLWFRSRASRSDLSRV